MRGIGWIYADIELVANHPHTVGRKAMPTEMNAVLSEAEMIAIRCLAVVLMATRSVPPGRDAFAQALEDYIGVRATSSVDPGESLDVVTSLGSVDLMAGKDGSYLFTLRPSVPSTSRERRR